MPSHRAVWLLLVVHFLVIRPVGATAQDAADASAPPDLRERTTAAVREYLRLRVDTLSAAEPVNVGSLEAWQAQRAGLRRQLFEMLGLAPLPARGDLRATVTGHVERDGVVVEKLHFQSVPGLYVTANFYRPKEVAGPLPTVLYLCGHGREVADGVSVGNKVHYQHHGAWFAKNGFCCLIIDTLQLGEIEGVHHGTYRLGRWWWINRGYTPAGVEAWNSIRALDYLDTRPEVDMKKLGVTGRSGGGAYTWWVAALDDRPACIVPVAGITDLEDHVAHDCIEGHCDCMFMVNSRGWDFATLAALAAPKPCLLANTDKDHIFPLGGVMRIHVKLRRIYELYGMADKLGLFISEGAHTDTQELQLASFRWLNRWLRDTTQPVAIVAEKLFTSQELKVFESLPADEQNSTIDETFLSAVEPGPPPKSIEAWEAQREELRDELRRRCFAGWTSNRGPLDWKVVADEVTEGTRLRIVEFTSEANLRLAAFVISNAGDEQTQRTRLVVADDDTWRQWTATYRTLFADTLAPYMKQLPPPENAVESVEVPEGEIVMTIAPRGWGPFAWLDDPKNKTHLPRRFALTGTTVDACRIWDVVTATVPLSEAVGVGESYVISGRGQAAAVALYAGLFIRAVSEFDLTDLPSRHRDGPILIGVERVLNMPQVLAMALERRVTLKCNDRNDWAWPIAVAELYGKRDAAEAPLRIVAP